MRLGEEGTKVRVTVAILDQHGEKRAVFHREIGPDDWPHALLTAGDGKTLRTVDAIAIEQRNSG